MFTPLKPPRGNSVSVAAHTGVEGSIVVNTDAKTIHVHDGITPGGFALSRVGHQHAQNEIVNFLGFTPVDQAGVGLAGGVAPLDQTGKVPLTMLPDNIGGGGDASSLTGTELASNVLTSSLTSVGVLTNLSVTNPIDGSITGGAAKLLTARDIEVSGDASGSASFDGSASIQINLSLDSVNASPVTNGLVKVTTNAKGLVTDTDPVLPADITGVLGFTPVSQDYVDNVASSIAVRDACRTATSTNLSAIYNNGAAGDGATLTGAGAIPAMNGVTPGLGDNVLVKNQTTASQNGPYVVTQVNPWILTRTGGAIAVSAGSAIFIQEGTLKGTRWVQSSEGAVTVGASPLNYQQFGASADYSAGLGISITNNEIANTGVRSLSGTANQVVASGSTGAVTLSLAPSIAISGTMTAASFSGGGSSLTSLNAANLATGIVPSARLGSGVASATTFLAGDGTWKAVSTSATTLAATGTNPRNSAVKGVYAGIDGGGSSSLTFTNSSAAVNARASQLAVFNSGLLSWSLLDDAYSNGTSFMTVSRSGNTATAINFTGTAIGLSGNTTVAGTFNASGVITGNGSGLTTLNGSNITFGTVAAARLGTGTPSTATFLRGDGTWATPTIAATRLNATDTIQRNSAVTGVYVGVGSSAPSITLTNATATVNNRNFHIYSQNNGIVRFALGDDAVTVDTAFMTVNRSGNTPTVLTFTANTFLVNATTLTLNGALTATSLAGNGSGITALNAASLASGIVPRARLGTGTADATTYLRGDGTWALVEAGGSGTVTTVSVVSANGITGSVANAGTTPAITLSLGAITPTSVTASGAISAASFSGSGASITALNAANLSTGIVPRARLGTGTADTTTYLRGDGTWATPEGQTGSFFNDPLDTATLTSGVSIGLKDNTANILLRNQNATANQRVSSIYVWNGAGNDGRISWLLNNDAVSTGSAWLDVFRSGNTASEIELTGTAITLNGVVTGNSFVGVGTGLTALNASNLASGTVAPARLGTGTANNTTYLRGDGTWATVAAGNNGTVTTVSVASANGITGSVATATTTPVITLTLGAITPTSVNTGAVTATSFSGPGTGITDLDAAELTTGTVARARLGTGTADATTFLRGDGTWAAPAGGGGGSTALVGTGAVSISRTTTGVYAGVVGSVGNLVIVNGSASADRKVWATFVDSNGSLAIQSQTDAGGAGSTNFLAVTRLGAQPATATMLVGNLIVTGQSVGATSNGGATSITAAPGGTTSGNGGALVLASGTGSSGTTSGNGGDLTLQAGGAPGAATAGTTGNVRINQGATGPTGNSGLISVITSAGGSTSGASGRIEASTGNTTAGATGRIDLFTGSSSTSGITGLISIRTGSTAATSATGAVNILTGNAATGTAGNINSGAITLDTGTTNGGTSGLVRITTGSPQGGATAHSSGTIAVSTGTTIGLGASGAMTLSTGNADGTGTTGGISIISGNAAANASSGSINIAAGTCTNQTTGNGSVILRVGGASGVQGVQMFKGGWFGPITDNNISLGAAASRFTQLFAASTTISTSDENLKTEIKDLDERELLVAARLKKLIKKFKFKDSVAEKGSRNSRWHVGVIAQEVQMAFDAEDLDASDYAIFCSDTWWSLNGEVVQEGTAGAEKVTRLGVRYEELLAFIIAAM